MPYDVSNQSSVFTISVELTAVENGSKKTWINDPVIDTFISIGTLMDTDLAADEHEILTFVKPLEAFVYKVYDSKGPGTLPLLRWNYFHTRNLEREKLPPT